ncbi:MAG: transposase [Patescibacteria group bacterium]
MCPQGKPLCFAGMEDTEKGCRKYVCKDCGGCLAKTRCTKGKNRQIQVNQQLDKYRSGMREKLNSEQGKKKYLERMSEVEAPFGNILYNQNAR